MYSIYFSFTLFMYSLSLSFSASPFLCFSLHLHLCLYLYPSISSQKRVLQLNTFTTVEITPPCHLNTGSSQHILEPLLMLDRDP